MMDPRKEEFVPLVLLAIVVAIDALIAGAAWSLQRLADQPYYSWRVDLLYGHFWAVFSTILLVFGAAVTLIGCIGAALLLIDQIKDRRTLKHV